MSDIVVDGISGNILRQYIERIERLELEKVELSAQIRDLFAEAKSDGLDPKVMRQVIKLRKMKKEDVDEHEALIEVYKKVLGMESHFDDE